MANTQTSIQPDEAALKRLAMGVFLQMPADLDEAARVLGYLEELLKWHRGTPYSWLETDLDAPSDDPPDNPPGDVLRFMKRG